ncbi:MAG: hypothetical protein ACYS0G_10000 [Planctomycetota bacterium]|jgi:hypothetical protein
MKLKKASLVTSTAVGLAAALWAGPASAQVLISADGQWTAEIDGFGQVQELIPPGQGFDKLSETYIYEASPDGMLLSRRVQDSYEVTDGPIIDQNQTHSYTRLANAVGGGSPPSGDCCEQHEDPGCEDPACEAAVCDIDSFCCDVTWDDFCAETAQGDPACDCTAEPAPLTIEIENFMVSEPNGGVLVVIRAINESGSDPISMKLFYYCDYDIGSPEQDEAAAIFDGGLLAIEQFVFPDLNPLWLGGCPTYASWDIDEWPFVRDRLDAGVAELPGTDQTDPGAADHSSAISSETTDLEPGGFLEWQVGLGAPEFSGCLGPACPWDLTGDDFVGINDLLILLAAWGPNPGHPADFNGDDFVGINDLLALLANWGACS